MNVLYIGPLFPHPGGAAITCSQLLASLARQGHRIRAFAPITEAALRDGDPMRAVYPEIHVSRYLQPHFEVDPGNPPSDPSFRNEERRLIREYGASIPAHERPDILLAGRENFAFEMPVLAARFNAPWILRLGGWPIRRVAEGTYPGDHAVQLLESMIEADLIVAQAEHMLEWTRRLGCDKVSVIPNFVDLPRFAPRPKPLDLCHALGIGPEHTVVLHASNLKSIKCVDHIVTSAPRALQADPNLIYVIAGDGPCREALEQQSRSNGTYERFRFPGWVDYSHMPEYLALADMVVMSSAHEQQARMYLETQASSRVLISSDIPAAKEMVEHGRTGLLYRQGDVDDLAAKTLAAARDPELRVIIGRQARKRVEAHGIDRVSALFASAMEDLVERHRFSKSSDATRSRPALSPIPA